MPTPSDSLYPEKEIAQLREKATIPFSGSEFLRNPQLKMPTMATRILQVCFDLQRLHELTDLKTFAGMAVALAEALDNMETTAMHAVNLQSAPPIMMCSECPRKEAILTSFRSNSDV